ncbi:perilipin-3-like [Emydura macquarii macquarii]|uniref:perilipin-3-like n=1 Tax=Emydura macquarii macquarii TaxID=1129001 RepID=UPI00352A8A27
MQTESGQLVPCPAFSSHSVSSASLDVTLPASENGPKAASSDTGLKTALLDNEEPEFAVNRVVSMPLVSSVYELAPAAYLQDSCPSTESACNPAEKEAEPVAAVDPAQPAQAEGDPQTGPPKETRSDGPDEQEGKLPAPPQPPPQVVTETTEPEPELVSYKRAEATPAAADGAGGAKGAGSSSAPKAGRPSDPSRLHGGGSTRTVLTNSLRTLMNSKVGQLFLRSVDRALDKSEELMNRYLPLTEKELAALTMEGLDASSAERHKKGCLVRLGSLSTSLRNRAFMMILNKLRQTRQSTHENLTQLHQTIELIEHIQQDKKVCGSREKLHGLWEQWSQKQPGGGQSMSSGSKDTGSAAGGSQDRSSKAGSSKDHRAAQLETESRTLAMSRSLTQQLQVTYLNLLSNVKGLPANLQEKMQQVHQNMAELHGYFSSANSFQDLSGSVLNQSREKVAKAWEALDEMMEFLLQNPPVTWLVESLVSLEGELVEIEEKPDILKVLQDYEPQDCKDD